MPNKAPADVAVRQEALDIRRSFLVQAPAGSGKTELLTQRFLVLLARVEQAEAVLAITFTNRAAGEMRDRVLRALKGASENSAIDQAKDHEITTRRLALAVLARDRQLGWHLLDTPSRLRIQTIDSLCASITHAMPSAAGFGGMLDINDSPDELYAAAAHATVLLLSGGSEADFEAVRRLLAHLDNDVAKVETLLAGMLRKRDQWLRLIGSGADPARIRSTLDATLARIAEQCLRRLHDAVPPRCAAELLDLARFAAAQAANAASPVTNCAALDELPGHAVHDRAAWEGIAWLLLTGSRTWRSPKGINRAIGFAAGSIERTRLQSLLEDLKGEDDLLLVLQHLRALPPAAYDDTQWEIARHLFHLLPRAVAELKLLFAERGQVDFAELAQAALRALGTPDSPSELAFALGCRIEHLLVDEYQDTSVTQQQLLERLTSTWDAGDGRTLFLVGDPMQSIYRFRQAEVGLFLDAAANRAIGNVALTPLELTVNFRSQEQLVDWVNDTFPQVFPLANDVDRSAVRYSPADPFQSPAAVRAVEVHPFLGTVEETRAAEDERVISLIEAARARDPRGTIAVLVRAKEHLATLVPKLRDRGLHFRAVDIQSLAERQIVHDLVSLTRALLHLGDRIAWLSILRAPWCGLGLQDLYALCTDDHGSCLWDLLRSRQALLSPDGRARVERVSRVLEQALAARGRQSIACWVRGAWLALGGPACATPTDLEDVSTFFNLLQELDDGGNIDDAVFAERIEKLFAHPDVEADGSLQLMSIHRAKGLEFDTVIVPGLGRHPRVQESQLLLWMERVSADGSPELLLAPISKKGSDTDELYKFIRDVESARSAEEDKRLLYVAVTRAKTQLHLLGHAELKDGELGQPHRRSLLAPLWPVVAERFERELQRLTGKPSEEKFSLAASAEAGEICSGKNPEGAPCFAPAAGAKGGCLEIMVLPAIWTPPASPPPLPCDVVDEVEDDYRNVTFEWVSDLPRQVGTVAHALLHKIAEEGLSKWSDKRLAQHRNGIRSMLVDRGVIGVELESAVESVLRVLREAINSERGRWVLDGHADAATEYSLTGMIGGRLRHVKLDRTFVADGVRWIVDYKISPHTGGGVEDFLDNEVRRYREQLHGYARVFAALDSRPIRLGLYFPLLGAWREWEFIA